MTETETINEAKSGYQVFLENLNEVKVEEDKRKMNQIKERLEQFKQKYYEFKKSPELKDSIIHMYVNNIKQSDDSLKELKTYLILEEGWPCDKVEFLPCVKYNDYIKITFKISEILKE